jgi:hypothetical protein
MNLFTMKKMIDNSAANFQGFEMLSENEMMEVRGGAEPRPKTREMDIFEEEN